MGLKDLTGKRFGRLTVKHRVPDYNQETDKKKRTYWLCVCDCGNECVINSDNLIGGRTKSCGCLRKEVAGQKVRTHGESKTHLYGVWSGMKARCNNPNSTYYKHYGGRGITICDEWNSDYESFKEWALSNGYKPGLTIDRINNDGNYEPSNCRWVDTESQANNRRSNVLVEAWGQTHNIKEWSDITGIPYKKLHNRIRSGWEAERALSA